MEEFKIIMPDKIKVGEDFTARLERVEQSSIPPDGILLQVKGQPEVWYMMEGKRRHITTMNVFNKMAEDLGFKWGDQYKYPIIQKELEVIPLGKPIKNWPELSSSEKGLFTLIPVPSPETVKNLGFNLAVIEKGAWNEKYAKGVAKLGINVIKGGWPISNEKECGIDGYFIADEPENINMSAAEVLRRYHEFKKQTSKPVGCVHMEWTVRRRNVSDYYREYFEVMQQLDFLLLVTYPFRIGRNPEKWMEQSYETMKVPDPPVTVIAQAFGIKDRYHVISDKQVVQQEEFWRGRGFGIVWYVWQGGTEYTADIRDNYQEVMKSINKK